MYGTPSDQLATTTVTVAEVLYGIELLPQGRRRLRLDAAFHEFLLPLMKGRILPLTFGAAEVFSVVAAGRKLSGRMVDLSDFQIAAIALDARGTMVTRNVRHFSGYGLDVLDPWAA